MKRAWKIVLWILLGLGFLINLLFFWIVFSLINVKVVDYPSYFLGVCRDGSSGVSSDEYSLILSDASGEPLRCQKVRIEEEGGCIESPCPDFYLRRRLRTARDGSIVVERDMFDAEVSARPGDDGPHDYSLKQYLFHVEGNYNYRATFEELQRISDDGGEATFHLEQKTEEECSHPRSSFRRNYCDGNQ